MINPADLRIGNWINDPLGKGYNNPGPVQVESINRKGINEWHDMGQSGCIGWEEAEPIPLTPEWLERCGFIDKGPNDAAKSTWLRENIYCPSFDSFEGAFYCSDDWGAQHFAYCEYIHQLQNAVYALTGTELEIKLP